MATKTKTKATTARKSRTSYRSDPAIQEFLDQMAKALTSGDGKAAAGLWSLPALVLGDQFVQSVDSTEQLEKLFGGAKEQYNAKGVTSTRGEIQRLEWLTDRIALVSVRWPWLDQDGTEHGDESSTYVLRKDDGGQLRMHAALMQGTSGEAAQM